MKINADIKYIKTCKKEELTPRFAKFKLALKSGTTRLQKKITKLVIEAELFKMLLFYLSYLIKDSVL